MKFSYRDHDESQFSLKWKCNFLRRELSFSVKASSYSCNYMILTRHCGYILKLLPLFLIILPFCSNKLFSSAMADCSFWDWFSLRGIWWKQSFAYISRPKLGRLRTDPAALLPADDNLSTPRVAWMKAGAGWQIKQTTSLLSCLIFWENKWFSALLTKKITGGKQLLTMCRWSFHFVSCRSDNHWICKWYW